MRVYIRSYFPFYLGFQEAQFYAQPRPTFLGLVLWHRVPSSSQDPVVELLYMLSVIANCGTSFLQRGGA